MHLVPFGRLAGNGRGATLDLFAAATQRLQALLGECVLGTRELERCAGTQFDPQVVEALLETLGPVSEAASAASAS